MIKFRQKKYSALVGLIASTGAGIGVSAVQTKKHHQQDMAQAEEFQRRQNKEQERQNDALNRIAKAAEKNPEKAQQAAAVVAQKSYAAVPQGFFKRAGNVTYDIAKALNKNGQAREKLAKGLAIGTTMALAGYGADKLVQADRKKITGGADLPKAPVDPVEAKKKRRKTIAKVGAGALAVAGTAIAAKHGKLGAGWEKVANRSRSQWKGTAERTGKDFLVGVKENVLPAKAAPKKGTKAPEKGGGAARWIGPGLTLLFPAMTLSGYALGERKQLKDQAREQQKQYAEQESPNKKRNRGSVLKKAATGTLVAAGAIAAGRRGAFGAKTGRYLNDWYMSRGAQINRLSGGKYGQKMVQSGSELWDKFNKTATQQALDRTNKSMANAKAGKRRIWDVLRSDERVAEKNAERIAKAGEKIVDINKLGSISGAQRAKSVLSGKTHTSLTKSVIDSKPVRFITFQEGNHQRFLGKLAKDPNVGEDTRRVARFLTTGTGQTLAALGSVGVGAAAMYPFTMGDKAVRKATKAVDKNAFAYEESKGQEV